MLRKLPIAKVSSWVSSSGYQKSSTVICATETLIRLLEDKAIKRNMRGSYTKLVSELS